MTSWDKVWKQFCRHRLGIAALVVVGIFCLAGIYAPFLASSKPLIVRFDGQWYFPLFRYLFYTGFYTKPIDLFFNFLMLTLPLFLMAFSLGKKRWLPFLCMVQCAAFACLIIWPVKDPAFDSFKAKERQSKLSEMRKKGEYPTWSFDLSYLNDYGKLDQVLRYQLQKRHHEKILHDLEGKIEKISTLWAMEQQLLHERMERNQQLLDQYAPETPQYKQAISSLAYNRDKQLWLKQESDRLSWEVMPLIRPFHWEEDAGGNQEMNQFLPWWELTRINRKDLVSALIFGVRISLVVGLLAVSLAMAIGVPIGALAGYYGGKWDILVCRLLEIWESMPTFFMLLLVVAMTQSKSIFIVIAVVGLFGWTGFSRYIRGEFFKQRNLPYVEACRAMGFKDGRIIFTHILPNAIPPVLTLLPFAVMAAITSEAGLSFLGLGEEGSTSWGVLMDEGRSAFPGESYLLWPPAILLTLLLVAIALVGDAMRDAIDPKMQK
ncbi:Inner membrane ABC transporter permease protein yejE [Waddlia chondrophila 2032/99]|uniref:Oligopeptide transport system permease protein OppC n=2 Tax=Waddlia chondrophila TaxID=71667 RepID=D6YU51_WADCW|nr:ABC transporter permease [Waddlia chondrophila]ADI37662.1 putative ABC-type oligopeptide transporter, permease subunit [Waddlia chondrophila WSU 86-1044]CCB90590.1 Inner membrane ABC transporter permease protein yejE [Waddlia chondrophila 2032/99]